MDINEALMLFDQLTDAEQEILLEHLREECEILQREREHE